MGSLGSGRAGQRFRFAGVVAERHSHLDGIARIGRNQRIGGSCRTLDVRVAIPGARDPLVAERHIGQSVGVGDAGCVHGESLAHLDFSADGGGPCGWMVQFGWHDHRHGVEQPPVVPGTDGLGQVAVQVGCDPDRDRRPRAGCDRDRPDPSPAIDAIDAGHLAAGNRQNVVAQRVGGRGDSLAEHDAERDVLIPVMLGGSVSEVSGHRRLGVVRQRDRRVEGQAHLGRVVAEPVRRRRGPPVRACSGDGHRGHTLAAPVGGIADTQGEVHRQVTGHAQPKALAGVHQKQDSVGVSVELKSVRGEGSAEVSVDRIARHRRDRAAIPACSEFTA